ALKEMNVSPYLVTVQSLRQGRSLVYAANRSRMASILIMEEVNRKNVVHAACVAGVKLNDRHVPSMVGDGIDDFSGDLSAIYIHDDRIGPYLRAEIQSSSADNSFRLRLKAESHVTRGATEDWFVRYLLIPHHTKIRLSLQDLRTIAL